MKNLLIFAAKLGLIFLKVALYVAVCFGKAAFAILPLVIRKAAGTTEAAAGREAEFKGEYINPLTGKVI